MGLGLLTKIEQERFRTIEIAEALIGAKSTLMSLDQAAKRIPNANILINTLAIQEAKTSSEIENIFTTVRDLFTLNLEREKRNPAAKEVQRYRDALEVGAAKMRQNGHLTTNTLIEIANEVNGNNAGIRRVPGVVIADSEGKVVYEPPQDYEEILLLLGDLEAFVNTPQIAPNLDPLVKMALIHWYFESIHPFADGNGRSGRILNVLYLVHSGLLSAPILYLSRQILRTKGEYYERLRAANSEDDLEGMIIYMLKTVEQSSLYAIGVIDRIADAIREYKQGIRRKFSFYSQDLINILFVHTYLTYESLMKELKVSRVTAIKYLNLLCAENYVIKAKAGRRNYYINRVLIGLLEEDD